MRQMANAIGAYQQAQLTVPPLQAVVMLYDGILVRIARAAQANEEGDYERQFNEVMSAARIVEGLNRCLDMDVGGSVAENLRSLYESVGSSLLRSTGRQYGATYLRQLGSAVRVTRDAWAEIAGVNLPAQTATSQPT